MPSRKSRSRLVAVSLLFTLTLPLLAVSAFAADSPEDAKIAVLPFQVNAGDDLAYLKDSLPELIGDRLRDAGFAVIGQDVVGQAMESKGIRALDISSAKEVALLAQATFAVYGSFSQVGETLSLDARLVDAFGIRPTVPIYVTKEGMINLLPAVDELVDNMRSDLLRKEKIVELEVEGTQVLDKDVVLMRLTVQKGDIYIPRVMSAELKNVYDLGYFDDVQLDVSDVAGGKRIVFKIKEKPRIQALGVRGADAIDTDDILEAVSTKMGAVLNLKVLADDIRLIREMYRNEGHYNAKVSHLVEDTGTGQARLTYVIEEGSKLYIEDIVIQGAEVLDPDDIKDYLALKERGILSWFTGSGVLNEEFLQRDAAAIMAYYADRGFLNAQVGSPEVEIGEDGIKVIFSVVEGDRFKLGKVDFEGDLITDPGKLNTVIKSDDLARENDYLNRSVMRDDIQSLVNHYNNFGYAYAEADVRAKDNPETKVVDLTFILSKHQKVHVRRVQIEGNTKTRDNVILRELELADGDQFSGDGLRNSIDNLDSLDYFGAVDIEPVPTGDPDEMDLKVKVKEKATGQVGGGVGWSTYSGPYIGAQISERNLFGKGYGLSFQGGFSGKGNTFSLSFKNPRINDSDLGFSVTAHRKTEETYSYDKDSIGGTVSFYYPLGEHTGMSFGYSLDSYEIYDIDDDASDALKEDEGHHLESSGFLTMTRSTINKRYSPSDGSIYSFSFGMGGGIFLGDDNYVKYVFQADNYFPLIGKDSLVFHMTNHIGVIHENFGDDDIPLGTRFYLGGINSIRGYDTKKVSPLDDDGERIGGNKEFFTNLEFIVPIDRDMGISAVAFFDAGNAWKEGDQFFSEPTMPNNLVDTEAPALGLYKSVGGGLRWLSPMGPLRFEYGYGLDDLYDSKCSQFEFSMGQSF